jgi:hypothetical protein
MARAKLCSDNNTVAFRCPGCKSIHAVPTSGPNAWGFNQNFDNPSFNPSIKVTYGDAADMSEELRRYCCHSVVTDGKIAFCNDCSHANAGQTLEIPEVDFEG